LFQKEGFKIWRRSFVSELKLRSTCSADKTLCRRDYLDYLKNRAKSGDMTVLQLTFRNTSLKKYPKFDPATGVSCLERG